MSLARHVSGLDAIRMLLTLGFRIRGANGLEASLQRDGCIVCVPSGGDLSEQVYTMLLDAARIDPSAADRLLARLRCRDTLPDTGEATPSARFP
jgi:hypothetical protein